MDFAFRAAVGHSAAWVSVRWKSHGRGNPYVVMRHVSERDQGRIQWVSSPFMHAYTHATHIYPSSFNTIILLVQTTFIFDLDYCSLSSCKSMYIHSCVLQLSHVCLSPVITFIQDRISSCDGDCGHLIASHSCSIHS